MSDVHVTTQAGRTYAIVHRILTGIAALSVVLTLVMADWLVSHEAQVRGWPEILERGSFIPVAFIVLAFLGAIEAVALLTLAGERPVRGIALPAVIALTAAPWFSAAGWLGGSAAHMEGLWWPVCGLAVIVLILMVSEVVRGQPAQTPNRTASTLLVVLYCGFLPSFGVQICCDRYGVGREGVWAILMIVLVTKSSDIGGYLVGTFFGRRRLAPRVSAGKTWEGTAGGVLASMALAALIVWSSHAAHAAAAAAADAAGTELAPIVYEITGIGQRLGYSGALFFGVLLGVIALFGDLFESLIKRAADRKDSACLLPGYGGILDLTDSLWATLPVAWLLLTEVLGVL